MGYGGRGYGYTEGGYGYGVSDFVGVVDVLRGLGGDPYSAWALRRLSGRYNGPVARLRRADNAELDFFGQGSLGLVSTDAVRAWNGWNLLPNTVFANTGGTSPTSWNVFTSGTTTSAAASSTVFAGETAWAISATAGRCFINNTAITAVANTTYVLSFVVESITGSLTANQILDTGSTPAGSTKTYPICEANPTGGAAGVVTTGRMIMVFDIGATAGTVRMEAGVGTDANRTGTIRLSRPQLEVASSFSTYEPRTTTGAGSSFLVTLYDQTGASRNFTQATTTLQLIVCESGVPVTEGGRLAARFVAADARRMAVASSTAAYNFLHTTGGSVAVVSRANDTAADQTILANKSTDLAAGIRIFANASDESFASRFGRQNVAGVATDGYTIAGTFGSSGSIAQRIAAMLFDPDAALAANRAFCWVNGTQRLTNNAQTAVPFVENSQGNMTLGAASAGGIPFDGTIQEILIWDTLISDAVRDAYEADAGRFYGITVA